MPAAAKRNVEPLDVWIRRGQRGALVIVTSVSADGSCRVYTPHRGTSRETTVATVLRDYRYERRAG